MELFLVALSVSCLICGLIGFIADHVATFIDNKRGNK